MAITKSQPYASKIRFATTLTSGTSYTVPLGVTYLNVSLIGGGGGGGGAGTSPTDGSTGGTTTFTGATSALGGAGSKGAFNPMGGQAGVNAPATTGKGGAAAKAWFNSVSGTAATHISEVSQGTGMDGQIINSIVAVTPGASIAYAIGAGGACGTGVYVGGNGGSGRIEVEYWV